MSNKRVQLWVSPEIRKLAKTQAVIEGKSLREHLEEIVKRDAKKKGLKEGLNDMRFF